MQPKNWNDLRVLLALKRGRTLAGAARLLGIDDTTVSRRLSALQSDVGVTLYQRRSDGALHLTTDGEAVADCAESMEQQADLMAEKLGAAQDSCAGVVRLTSVPILINRLLAPKIGALLAIHPDLQVELVPDARDLSLTRREADLAVRLARPTTGGTAVKAWRIGYLDYAVYASCAVPPNEAAHLPWITYEEAMAHIPQARWISKMVRGRSDLVSGLRVHDAETALEAVAAGLGKAVLPTMIAGQDERLCRMATDDGASPPSREIWLLAHADQRELRRVAVVAAWIGTTVSGPREEDQAGGNRPRAIR